MTVRLSVVVATMCRATLHNTLASLLPQLNRDDEVLIVADSRHVTVDAPLISRFDPDSRCDWFQFPGADTAGDAQRAHGIAYATGTHVCFIDDDDEYADGALDAMRTHAADVPTIFRMDHPLLGVLWRRPEIAYANVGTPMFLIPNDPDRMGGWDDPPTHDDRAADFGFISGCVARMGQPVWRREITVNVRPGATAATWDNRLAS